MNIKQQAVKKAIGISGGQKHLAEQLGVTVQLVSMMLSGVRDISPINAMMIEAITKREYKKTELRPDIYKKPNLKKKKVSKKN